MIYEEYGPSAATRDDVEAYWRFRLESHEPEALTHVIPPDGAINLCLERRPSGELGVALLGPGEAAHVTQVARNVVYAGVRLRPGGRLRIPGAAPLEISGAARPEVSLDPVLACWIGTALTPLLDGEAGAVNSALAEWPFGRAAPDPVVAAVADQIIHTHGAIGIEAAAQAAGVASRTLRRRFPPVVGLTPKAFAGVRRLRRACVLGLDADMRLAQTSIEAGYSDQAHLSRATLESFGATPSAVGRYLRQIKHAFAPG